MASNSCTFIFVPDATSQCKRVTSPKFVLWGVGASIVMTFVVIGAVMFVMITKYQAMAMKADQLQKLKKISTTQKNTIERYEQDITQLSKHLAYIKQLNSRLMVLSGLDPAKAVDGQAVGGADDEEFQQDDEMSREEEFESEP